MEYVERKDIPTRRDGSLKVFWYDPDRPGHILHRREDGTIKCICVGHSYE